MTTRELWTVTRLTAAMGRLWTAKNKWTSRPQSAHNRLGQVIKWTFDLTTATWITARMDAAVTHTDHNSYDDEFPFLGGEEKRFSNGRFNQNTRSSNKRSRTSKIRSEKTGLTAKVNPGTDQIRASLRSEGNRGRQGDRLGMDCVIGMEWNS